jgi:hypothetical protein
MLSEMLISSREAATEDSPGQKPGDGTPGAAGVTPRANENANIQPSPSPMGSQTILGIRQSSK